MKKKLYFAVIFFCFFTTQSNAWIKTVLLSPVRVVIDKKKSASITIINTSNSKSTFRIEMVSMEMHENGILFQPEMIKPHAEKAIKMIKFSPRRVSLKPNGVQTIRLMVRKPYNLPKGEYRCQLRVTPLPSPPTKEVDQHQKAINININYLVSTSIPVIIRHGDISKTIKVKELKLKNEELLISMERTGKKSGLFNIEILQNNKIIGKRERTAFYFPNKNLKIAVKLNEPFNRQQRVKVRLVDLESENKKILDTFSSII